jgi:uncharacterized repeat protein (TIGR04076 family)
MFKKVMTKDDSFALSDLDITVIGDPDTFACSHVPGLAMSVIGENLVFHQDRFSLYALAAVLPLLPAKQRVTHPNDWMTTDDVIACPDPFCGGQFQITIKGNSVFKHSEVTKKPSES